MKINQRIRNFLLSISLLCITLFSTVTLSSCTLFDSLQYVTDSREEYVRNIDALKAEDTFGCDYVAQYLRELGTPVFDVNKVIYFEEVFRQYYNLKSGLPETASHAVMSAEYFAENYYETVDKSDKAAVTDAVVNSYVNVIGDVYSVYRPKEEFNEHLDDMSGSFGGIGVTIELDYKNETARITEVGIGSPAERAGLAVGDYIHAVDGRTLSELGFQNVAYYTRGEVGDDVVLTVRREGELLDFTITREVIEVKTVEYSMDEEKIGYIRVSSFKENTFEQFVLAIDYMKAEGAVGIIFDMRNNPGGYLDTVVYMLSYILPSDREIVSYDYKDGRHISIKSVDDQHPVTGDVRDHTVDIPMAVICNEYSASAAEIFTAAIRDYRDMSLIDAVTVGKTTYKKGIIQASFVYKPDESSVTLTIAYYAPPSGECYHGVGIEPDYTVENTESSDLQYSEAHRLLLDLVNNN